MKAFLMYRERDFDPKQAEPANAEELVPDLELELLLRAMAGGDKFIFEVARAALLSSLADLDQIAYRQEVLRDCLQEQVAVRQLYDLAVEALASERKVYRSLFSERHPEMLLYDSTQLLQVLLAMLRRLREAADQNAGSGRFRSQGFGRLFGTIGEELTDDYLASIEAHLGQVRFRDGLMLSAEIGTGNKGVRYVPRRPHPGQRGWRSRLAGSLRSPYSMEVNSRDEAGLRALAEIKDRGLNLVANALAQAVDHILSFFQTLRQELAFYVACLNLEERLRQIGVPTCLPLADGPGPAGLSAMGLCDPCLGLRSGTPPVGNRIEVGERTLVLITGANQGGKSTFLRSVGVAQLMFQAGMFVAAQSYSGPPCSGLFTHFKREEDSTMERGKLDEELQRMSAIADRLTPNCLVLFNESFSATNELEGSEIARQVIRALSEAGVRIFYVTHFFELAHSVQLEQGASTLFLRAEREPDGRRTFQIVEGEPLPTSFGHDVYQRIFVEGPELGAGSPGPGAGPGPGVSAA